MSQPFLHVFWHTDFIQKDFIQKKVFHHKVLREVKIMQRLNRIDSMTYKQP